MHEYMNQIENLREYSCHICSLPQIRQGGGLHICGRCGYKDRRLSSRSSQVSLIFALTALIFYIPANLLPFMSIELYGNHNSSTIWSGTLSLLEEKSYAVAFVVFFASILVPVLKLTILFYLSLGKVHKNSRFKMSLYQFVEGIGRWSMLDIFLLAIMVALVKLGKWTSVRPEIGSAMFAMVVVFTILSSYCFDPRVLWEEKDES